MSNEIFSSEFWEQKLLKHMQILNQTDLIKHTPTSNRHKSLQNFRVVVGNCHSKTREIQQKSVSKTSIIKNVDLEEVIKTEIAEEIYENAVPWSGLNRLNKNESDCGITLPVVPISQNQRRSLNLAINEHDGRRIAVEEKHCFSNRIKRCNTHVVLFPIKKRKINQNNRKFRKIEETPGCSTDASYRICCGDIAAKKEVEIIAEENTLNESRDEIINVTSFGNTPKLEPEIQHERDGVFSASTTFGKRSIVKQTSGWKRKRFKCEFCLFSTDSEKRLEKHLRFHKREKLQCEICLQVFSRKTVLSKHLRTVHQKYPFECSICDKFTDSGYLNAHMSTAHDPSKAHVCTVCECRYATVHAVKRHMLTHTGVRKYKCQFCDKRFSENGNLRAHERVHTGEKPHKCKDCAAAFVTTSHLHKHVIAQHTKNYPHRCSVCDKGFMILSALTTHEKKFHL